MAKLQDTLAADSRRATLAVVQIHAYGFNHTAIGSILDPRFLEPMTWRGSGFLIRIGKEDGYVLTNAHVVRNASSLQVMSLMTSEEMFAADIVSMVSTLDPDIALIKLTDAALDHFRGLCDGHIPHLTFGDSENVQRGTDVKAIGYPFGMMEPNMSGGAISNFIAGDLENSERLVTDAAINPGNSGGPAIVPGGHAIGINTSVVIDADNIGFITPIEWAKILLPQMLENPDARLADIGAMFQPNSEANARHLGLSHVDGVITMRAHPDGMLARAGLKPLDVVVGVDGFAIDRFGTLVRDKQQRRRNIYDAVRHIPVGKKVRIDYMRAGKLKRAQTVAIPMPRIDVPSQPLVDKRRFIEFHGLILQELSLEISSALTAQSGSDYLASVEGRPSIAPKLVVTFVMPGSPADDLFFAPGNVVTHVNGEPITGAASFVKKVKTRTRNSKVVLRSQIGGIGVFHMDKAAREALQVQAPPMHTAAHRPG
ncbi:MAG TPA: trypsin-like peptidase domain-containing protein [Polyangiales bacterium]|jgi:S1-C subfamily serine protease|nr:trypsin-like peptidase domain-containing protein [Polyangiales bacterium]